MISPITGKEMSLVIRREKLIYRKEEFEIFYNSYLCKDSGESFTDDDLDEINLIQIYNQYRAKYGIPFPDEIKEIREKYGLSASKISDILGLGTNSYRLYEAGEMPSVANGRLILAIKHSKDFINQLNASSALLEPKELAELTIRVNKLYYEEKKARKEDIIERILENSENPNEYNGYRKINYNIIAGIISRYSEEMELFKTKLNKLLFYTDYLFYRFQGYSMTGLTYKAITLGPVPSDYELLYTKLENDEKIVRVEKAYENGIIGEIIQSVNNDSDFSFTEKENLVLKLVIDKFRNLSATQIKDLSHKEKAWIENENERKKISYQKYAFDLVGI